MSNYSERVHPYGECHFYLENCDGIATEQIDPYQLAIAGREVLVLACDGQIMESSLSI